MNRQGDLHIVPGLAPVSSTGALYGDVIYARDAHEIEIVVLAGVVGSSQTITVNACTNFTPSAESAIAFHYQKTSAVGTDAMGAVTLLAATTGTTMVAGTILRIFINPAELPDGYPYLRVVCTSSGTCLIACYYIIRDRYPNEVPISAVV